MKADITTAGAGSGKTTELTTLMRDLIISGKVRPNAILATTFTKASATELAQRVRLELFKAGLFEEAGRLEEALMGTVHSICQRLLARFAFEARISPHIEVLDEAAGAAAVSEAIERSCALADVAQMEELARRLGQRDPRTGQSRWKGQVRKVISAATENAIAAEALSGMAEASVQEVLDLLPAASTEDLDGALRGAIDHARQHVDPQLDTTQKTAKAIEMAIDAHKQLAQKGLLWSEWWQLAKIEPGTRSRDAFQPLQAIAARVEEHPKLREDLQDYVRGVFKLASRALQTYEALKRERGQMDFTDLEALSVRLLDDPRVQECLGEEYDLLLVDEFQDTSPIQLELFMKLSRLVKVRSVWVGDMKQAIYGFRGSDPDLMASVVAEVQRQGRHNKVLERSFRTRNELCEWFNRLFAPAFGSTHGMAKKQVDLKAVRPQCDGLPPPLQLWSVSTGEFNKGDGQPKRPTAEGAATAVAGGIGALLDKIDRVSEGHEGATRDFRLRDIAVLCRTNDHADRIAAALSKRGIPVARKSGGLMSTPEVLFALACLRRLIDSRDSLASATIIALSRPGEPEKWLQDRLEWLGSADHDGSRWGIDGEAPHPGLKALEEARVRQVAASPTEALDEALALGNAFEVVTRWGPSAARAAQRRANLESLRGMALRYESLCSVSHQPATVAGFVWWADGQQDAPVAVNPGADAVQVFTYHGAKGLEWPVVVCTELDAKPSPRLWDAVTVVSAVDFDPCRPLMGRRLRFWPWPFGQNFNGPPLRGRAENSEAGRAAAASAAREELRLLYVGFSRTRDSLVLEHRERSELVWPTQALREPFTAFMASALVADFNTLVPMDHAPALLRETWLTDGALEEPNAADAPLRWFPAPAELPARPPAFQRPSDAHPVDQAQIGRVIEVGPRLQVSGQVEEVALGNVVHAIFAPVLMGACNAKEGAGSMAQQLVEDHGLQGRIRGADVVDAAQRLREVLAREFEFEKLRVEIPFEHPLADGSRVTGFVDLAVETRREGWVIVDHKTFRGDIAACRHKALSHSGQLARYRAALEAAGNPVLSHWIYFPVAGILVEVCLLN